MPDLYLLFIAVRRELQIPLLYYIPRTRRVVLLTHSALQNRRVVSEEQLGSRAGQAAPQSENVRAKVTAPHFLFERR